MVGVHTRAMGTVVAHRIRGDGGDNGKKLLGALDAAVKMAISRE